MKKSQLQSIFKITGWPDWVSNLTFEMMKSPKMATFCLPLSKTKISHFYLNKQFAGMFRFQKWFDIDVLDFQT
jgi:hypothetical protein